MPDIQCIYPNYDDITGHWPRKGSWWRNVSFNFTTDRGWWTTIICPAEPGSVFWDEFLQIVPAFGSLGAFSKHHGLSQIQNNAGSIHSHLPPTKLLPLSLLLQLGDVSSWCCCGRQRAICVSDFPKVSKSKHHLRAAVWSCMRGKRTPLRGIKFILIFRLHENGTNHGCLVCLMSQLPSTILTAGLWQ